jgi:hypothetical protein
MSVCLEYIQTDRSSTEIKPQIAVQCSFNAVDTTAIGLQTQKQKNKTEVHSFYFDGRLGVVVGILAYSQEVAGSITAQCKHLCA